MASLIKASGKALMLDGGGLAPGIGYAALYTDAAGTTEVAGGTYARKAVTYNASSNGVLTNSAQIVFDVPAGVTVQAVGLCSALTGGTQHVIDDVTAEAFAGAGTYTVAAGQIIITLP